ncbi:MAG: SpoIIE family protein phosphatase [Candidatus Kapaibacterium sp.]
MKPLLNNLSARLIRVIVTSVTLLALIPCLYMFMYIMVLHVQGNDECLWIYQPSQKIYFITRVVQGGVADQAGIKNGDYLVRFNGIPFEHSDDAVKMLNNVPLNGYATYTIQRGTQQFDTKIRIVKVFDYSYFSVFLLGFGFLVVGYTVAMTKPVGVLQRRFWLYGLLSLLFFSVPNPPFLNAVDPINLLLKHNPEAWDLLMTPKGMIGFLCALAFHVSRIFAPPMFILFFTRFPVDLLPTRRTLATAALFCFNFGIVVFNQLNGYKLIKSDLWANAIFIVFSPNSYFTMGLAMFVYVYMKYPHLQHRERLRPIIVSICVVLSTFTYLILINIFRSDAIFTNPILLTPTLLFIGLPLAFGVSIFRYGLMDIDAVVRRSLVYAGLTAAMAGIYLLLVVGFGSFLERTFGTSESKVLNIMTLIAIAFALDPMKRRAQEAIDRLFYQERLNYQKVLLEFSRELPSKINIREILQTTMQRITGTMHVENVVAAMFDNFGMEQQIPPDYYTPDSEPGSLYNLMLERKAPLYFADTDSALQSRLNATEYERITQFGIALTIPMILKDKLIGTINVGQKLNGKPFSQEDIDLLSTVASQAAIAIENARLHQGELEKIKIAEELALARSIQKQLLPKCNPDIAGLDICASNEPALVVGGDYYDYISISPTKLLVVVADVSGKGMSAALYMSKIQGMMHLAAHLYDSPKEILTHVNRHLYATLDRKYFISLVIAVFDTEKNTVTFCRAGHTLPLIRQSDTFEYYNSAGLALGLVKGNMFAEKLEEVTLPLTPSSAFIFYTDGVTEAEDIEHSQFGEDNLLHLVNSLSERSSSGIEAAISGAIIQFQGALEQHDDRTVVVIKIGSESKQLC